MIRKKENPCGLREEDHWITIKWNGLKKIRARIERQKACMVTNKMFPSFPISTILILIHKAASFQYNSQLLVIYNDHVNIL